MAGIILCSTGRSCGRGNRKTESVTYPFKKNHMALDQSWWAAKQRLVWCSTFG